MATPALTATNPGVLSAPEEANSRNLVLSIVHRYASLAREKPDRTLMAALFTPTGVIKMPDGRELTPAQLSAITNDNRPDILRHHLTTVDVQFESATKAKAQAYVIAHTNVKMPDHWGLWEFALDRGTDGGWRIEGLAVSDVGTDPDGWLAGVMAMRAAASQEA